MPDVGGNPGLTYIWTTAIRGVTSQNPNAADVHGVKHRIAAAIALGLPSVTRRESAAFWYAYEGRTLNDKQIGRLTNLYTRAGLPLPLTPVPGGPSIADQAGARPFADWGFLARATYRRGRKPKKKKKKKSRLRDAAAVLAARVLQTGEEVFSDLLTRGRSAARYVEPDFDRLLKKVPSEFERILARRPTYVPRELPGAVVRGAASAAAAAARYVLPVLAGVLYPSSIGETNVTTDEILRRVPRTRTLPRRPEPPRGAPTRTREPRPLPLPTPVVEPLPQPGPVQTPRTAPRSPVVRAPTPAPSPRPLPSPRTVPTRSFDPSFLLLPLLATFNSPDVRRVKAPGRLTRPIVSPLTMAQPYQANSQCDCQKPTRTKRERKKRCSNPVIRRSRTRNTITITRRIKCPA